MFKHVYLLIFPNNPFLLIYFSFITIENIIYKLRNKYFLMAVNIVFNFYSFLYEPRQKTTSL